MMKLGAIFATLIYCFSFAILQAQTFADIDKSVMDMAYFPKNAPFQFFAKSEEEKKAAVPKIRVIYSRPLKNGRKVFGELEKYGNIWRVGANESTEITFYQDVMVGETKVAAGRYSVYALINEDNWEVMFNTDLDGWGHYAYDKSLDVATITVPTEKSEKTIEAFSIVFEESDSGAHMIMGWDDTIVRVPIGL